MMLEKLKEIRNELLIGAESKDLLYIKMQINKLDTLIYEASQEKECGIIIGRQFGKESQTRELLEEKIKGKGCIVIVGADSEMMNQEFIRTMSKIPNVQFIPFENKNVHPIGYEPVKPIIEELFKAPIIENILLGNVQVFDDEKSLKNNRQNFNKNSYRKKKK